MACSDLSSKEVVRTIPSGLNRIKTGREQVINRRSSQTPDDSGSFDHQTSDRKQDSKVTSSSTSASSAASTTITRMSRQKTYHHLKFGVLPRGFSRGKKIKWWFASYLSKDHSRALSSEASSTKDARTTNRKAHNKESYMRSVKHNGGKDPPAKQPPLGNNSEKDEVPKDYKSVSCELGRGVRLPPNLKSFSHELGRGIDAAFGPPKAPNHRNLKELLGSLHLKFDEAKEIVNVELSSFIDDVVSYLKENDGPFTGYEIAEELLHLAQRCIEMPTFEFREKCEGIVQDLREKRQLCPTGLLKWLVTHMLFILTRCTRLLQFQKDIEPVNSKAFHKYQNVLESIPSLDMNWLPDSETDSSDVGTNCIQKGISEHSNTRIELKTLRRHDYENYKLPVSSSEQDNIADGSQSVICRICEEYVSVANLEFHSYICAHAEKCDMACLSVNERLSKLTELLEQIIESCNSNSTGGHLYSTVSSPEILRLTPSKSLGAYEACSPKVLSEWQNKGVEGMFEDLHEMDTAYMEDCCTVASIFTKGPLAIKLGSRGPSSTNGSMTPGSSSTTPRASHFDFWLEQYNPCRLEDVQQMRSLADVAHKAVMADVSEDCSCEILFACMIDLQEILQRSILKALVVDTIGRRIESLLREKYMLISETINTIDEENSKRTIKWSKVAPDDASQCSAMATALNSSNRERIRIDDFHIIKPISRGAYGRVFLARKRTTGDFFAIKVLNKLDIIRKNDIERILAERNILIAVRNPFMVRFYYSFTSKDNLYLVMEYLNGGDLYSLLRKVGCLEEDIARIYIAELVLALEYLHSIEIVHRDLKPDNILIAQDGHIKLTDFGLSKYGLMNSTTNLYGVDNEIQTSLDTRNSSTQPTEEEKRQSAVGTPDYLAPEILLGMDHGFAADWWSVGIVLFELINGIPPFSGDCPEVIFGNILNRKIPWPPSSSDMSTEARDLVDRLLMLDPAERLGANGASEVKTHPFFKGLNWDTLSSSEAAFVPQPDTVDDTSYFVPRYEKSFRLSGHDISNYSASETSSSCSNDESQGDGCSNLEDFESSPIDFLSFNFSFKNLSQLATINHDVLRRSGKDQASLFHSYQDEEEV